MLAVVEAGFGDFKTFNSLVRSIFEEKIEQDVRESPPLQKSPLESRTRWRRLGLLAKVAPSFEAPGERLRGRGVGEPRSMAEEERIRPWRAQLA